MRRRQGMRAVWIALGAMLVFVGCAHHRYWVGRHVERSAKLHTTQLPITMVRARVHMGYLEVWVRTKSPEETYRSDFALEERYVAMAIWAVAKSEVVFDQQWIAMDLEVWNRYGQGFHMRQNSGLYMVRLSREHMEHIRSGALPPEDLARSWTRRLGVKQGPDGELIEWPADAAEPLRRPSK